MQGQPIVHVGKQPRKLNWLMNNDTILKHKKASWWLEGKTTVMGIYNLTF